MLETSALLAMGWREQGALGTVVPRPCIKNKAPHKSYCWQEAEITTLQEQNLPRSFLLALSYVLQNEQWRPILLLTQWFLLGGHHPGLHAPSPSAAQLPHPDPGVLLPWGCVPRAGPASHPQRGLPAAAGARSSLQDLPAERRRQEVSLGNEATVDLPSHGANPASSEPGLRSWRMPLVTWHPSEVLCRAGCHLAPLDLGSSAWGLHGSLLYMV